MDETYIGGKEANKHEYKKQRKGRGPVGIQALVTERNTPKPPSTGASTPMTPEPNCTASIPLIPNMTEY